MPPIFGLFDYTRISMRGLYISNFSQAAGIITLSQSKLYMKAEVLEGDC